MRDNTIKKIKELQYMLASGKSRSEIARELGYKDVTAIYHFASRHKLKWNPRIQNYEAQTPDGTPIEALTPPAEIPTGRAAGIIAMFEQGMDAREIAKHFRFADNSEMAAYMKARGYVWDDDAGNYIKTCGDTDAHEIKPKQEEDKLTEYEELLHFLNINKNRLVGLLTQTELPAYSGTSGRRIRRHPDRCTGIIRTAFPAVSGHLVEYVF